jgi:hypothetical protein
MRRIAVCTTAILFHVPGLLREDPPFLITDTVQKIYHSLRKRIDALRQYGSSRGCLIMFNVLQRNFFFQTTNIRSSLESRVSLPLRIERNLLPRKKLLERPEEPYGLNLSPPCYLLHCCMYTCHCKTTSVGVRSVDLPYPV